MNFDPLKRRLFSTVAAGALAMSAGSRANAQVNDEFDPVRALAGVTSSPMTAPLPTAATPPAVAEPLLYDRTRLELTQDYFSTAPEPQAGRPTGITSNAQSSPEITRLLDEIRKLIQAKKHADALPVIERALAIEPQNLRVIEERSRALAGVGRYADGFADNERLIAAEPRRVFHKIMRVLFLWKLNRLPEAFEVADALVKSDPQYVYAYYTRAYVLIEMGRPGDAMTDLNLALEKDANLISALVLRASLNLKKANHDAVIADTSRVLERNPKELDSLVFRGESYVAKEQFELAILDFQAALAINPNLTAAKRGLEVALSRQASATKAPLAPAPPPALPVTAPVSPSTQFPSPPPIITPATLTRPVPSPAPAPAKPTPQVVPTPGAPPPAPAPVVPVVPQAPAPAPTTATPAPVPAPATGVDEAFKAQVMSLVSKRMFKEAMAAVDAQLAAAPANASLIHLRGVVFAAGASYELALAEYEKALKIEPRLRPALSDRALASFLMGRHQQTIEYCNQALAAYADAFEVINYRGLAKMNLGNLDDALADFSVLTSGHPRFVLGWFNRGRVYAAKKDNDKALADFNQALQIDPRHSFTLGQRGLIHLAKHDFKAAEADFKTALEINSTEGAAKAGMQAIQVTRAMEQLGQIRKGG